MSYKSVPKRQMKVNSLNIDVSKLLNKYVKKAVYKLYDINLSAEYNYIEVPSNREYGVFSSNIAFTLAKNLKRPPEVIASELAQYLRDSLPLLNGNTAILVDTVSGFVNFKLSFGYLKFILSNLYTTFGVDKVLLQDFNYKNQTVVIEYASPNPNKVMHSGHFRNIAIATPLINTYRLLGARVYTDMVLNDKGIAISKVMVGYLAYGRKQSLFKLPSNLSIDQLLNIDVWYSMPNNWETPETINMLPDYFVDKFYVLGNKLTSENKKAALVAQRFVEQWELNNKKVYKLWELIINWGLKGQQRVFKQLKCHFDTIWRESDHYLLGKKLVKRGLRAGVLKIDTKEKQGAVVADLTDKQLGKFVLLRSDGTSLYSTQDIALAKLKVERYKANTYIYVVGAEQSTHFAQLFETLRRLGIIKNENLVHMAYGLLLMGGKKASSREGGALYIDNFIKHINDYLKKNFDLPPKTREKLADFIARVAITKVSATKAINFDIKEAASIKGHTGAYLMYTYVRALNILNKNLLQYPTKKWLENLQQALVNLSNIQVYDAALALEDLELMAKLVYLPYYIRQTVKTKDPSVLVNYAFELADAFNSYYEKIPVLKAKEDIRDFRLYIVHAVKSALELVIQVLGGQPINKM